MKYYIKKTGYYLDSLEVREATIVQDDGIWDNERCESGKFIPAPTHYAVIKEEAPTSLVAIFDTRQVATDEVIRVLKKRILEITKEIGHRKQCHVDLEDLYVEKLKLERHLKVLSSG